MRARKLANRVALRVQSLEDRSVPSGTDPIVLISGAPKVPEAESYVLNLTAVDAEHDPITGWTINWGDGQVQNLSGNPSTALHAYSSGPASVTITATATVDGTAFPARLADSGHLIDVFVASGSEGLNFPRWMTFGPDGSLYVTQNSTNRVLRFNGATGVFIDEFVASGGIQDPTALTFGPNGDLFVASFATGSIGRFNGTTGAFVSVIVPANSGGLTEPSSLSFGPDGNLYVGNSYGEIRKYNGTTGAYISRFNLGSGLGDHTASHFGADGKLYVNGAPQGKVAKYDVSGTNLGDFVPAWYGNNAFAYGMDFGPDGDFYLTSGSYLESNPFYNKILRYDASTGVLIDIFAAGNEMTSPFAAQFGPDGNLYVSDPNSNSILRYGGPLTAGAATQLPVTVLDVFSYSNTTKQKITGTKTIWSTVTVPQSFTVADVNVNCDIDHTNDSDIHAFLISPSGTRVELFTRVGGTGDNFRNTTIDDEARLPFSLGTAPFSASYYPEGRGLARLNAFDGQSATGTWTLEISDVVSGNNGQFNRWTLSLAKEASSGNGPMRVGGSPGGQNKPQLTPPPINSSNIVPIGRFDSLVEPIVRHRRRGTLISPIPAPIPRHVTGSFLFPENHRSAYGTDWILGEQA